LISSVCFVDHISAHNSRHGRRSAIVAGFYLLGCWTTRAVGSALLLGALGFAFSPTTALVVLCLSAAAGVIPITAGGAVANVGATAGILLALGVGKDLAINFSLASRLLLVVWSNWPGHNDCSERSNPRGRILTSSSASG
jgi:hypothetical protein